MLRNLRTQLSLAMLLTLLLTIGLIGLLSNWFINKEFTKYITVQEEARSKSIVEDFGRQYNAATHSWNVDYLYLNGMYALYEGYILKIYDINGNIVWDAENHDTTLCGQIMDDISHSMEMRGAHGSFITKSHDINQNGQKVGTVSVTYYGPYFLSDSDTLFISTMNKVLLIIGVLSGFFAILVGFALARRIARPVTEAAYVAKEIQHGEYNIHIANKTSTREIYDLTESINHLAKALNEQEQLRKQLTTDVAHELRTPLTAVSSHLEAMIDGIWEITPKRLQGCRDEVTRLETLVADLERLTKAERENIQLNKTSTDLLELAKTTAENFHPEFAKKNLALAVGGQPCILETDKDKVRQIITNLLSNAVKYTPAGGSVQIEVTDTAHSGIIMVSDSGIGIPEAEQQLIFERFYRAEKSRNRLSGGAGIGLTIVKATVEALGGTVTLQSAPEKGSCFIVTLPKE